MSRNKFGEGFIEIKADNSPFLKELSRTGSLFKGWAGELAAAAGIVGFGAMIKSTAEFGDEMVKTSQKVGIGVEALQKLTYAAGLSDLELGQLSVGLRFLSRNLADTGSGGAKALSALGLSAKQLREVGLDEALLSIADKIRAMSDGYAKVAVMQEIFGKGAMALIPLMNQGSEAIRSQMTELQQMGGIMSEGVARQSEELNDNLTRLGFVGKSLAITVGNELIPVLVEATSGMIEWWKANNQVISQDIRLFFRGAAVSGQALGQTLVNLGNISGKTFEVGSLAARGFWELINLIGSGVSKIVEGFAYSIEHTVLMAKEVYVWIQNNIPKFWQDAAFMVPVKGGAGAFDSLLKDVQAIGASAQKSGADFNKAAAQIQFASESMSLSWNTGTGATQAYAVSLDDIINKLGKTGKEAEKQAKVMMEAYSDMLSVMNAMGMGGSVSVQNLAEGGLLGGGESLWGRISGGGYAGGNLNRDMSAFGGYGFAPGQIMTDEQKELFAAHSQELIELYQSMFTSITPDAGMIAYMGDQWGALQQRLEEEQQKLIDSFLFMGMNLTEMSDWMSGLISNFFADSAAQGFGAGIKKLIGSLINTYADFVIKNGMIAMATGLFEIVMGSSPVWPRPDWVAHGGYAMAQGAILLGIGGALKGGAAALSGSFNGAGGGASFQTNAARPTAGTVQPVTYDVSNAAASGKMSGGGTVNIYAWDSQSLDDYVSRNKHTFASGVHAAGYENHPIREGW